jgi:hypothetical protein
MHDGIPLLYDVNNTPGGGRIKLNNPRTRKNIETLTKGIKNYFK